MEKSIEQMVQYFKEQYSTKISKPGQKFSAPLDMNKIEMEARLNAAYELNVEWRGGQINRDKVTKESIESVATWIYDNKRWLFLSGALGTGKTTMLKALRTIFPASIYCSAKKIFDEFKRLEMLPDVSDNKLLLLDDLGVEPSICKIFGEDRSPITDLLLHRYDWMATTVIATNLSIDEIQARYGDRLADRIAEMATAILYDAPSYRGR